MFEERFAWDLKLQPLQLHPPQTNIQIPLTQCNGKKRQIPITLPPLTLLWHKKYHCCPWLLKTGSRKHTVNQDYAKKGMTGKWNCLAKIPTHKKSNLGKRLASANFTLGMANSHEVAEGHYLTGCWQNDNHLRIRKAKEKIPSLLAILPRGPSGTA